MPKRLTKEHMVLISFHIPKQMLDELNMMAQKEGMSRSELIRIAIRLLFLTRQQLSTSSEASGANLTIGR